MGATSWESHQHCLYEFITPLYKQDVSKDHIFHIYNLSVVVDVKELEERLSQICRKAKKNAEKAKENEAMRAKAENAKMREDDMQVRESVILL